MAKYLSLIPMTKVLAKSPFVNMNFKQNLYIRWDKGLIVLVMATFMHMTRLSLQLAQYYSEINGPKEWVCILEMLC